MATGQQSLSAGRILGFIVVLGMAILLLAALLDRAIIAMGGHAVAMCAFVPVIGELGGIANGLFVFVTGLVLLALAGGRSRIGALLLLAGTVLAAVPGLAGALLDPGHGCTAVPAPPASAPSPQQPLQPRTALTPP